MTDRPILFSGPMVRALLDGRKTQTRRLCKDQPPPGVTIIRKTIRPFGKEPYHAFERRTKFGNFGGEVPMRISRGDRLWVKERGWIAKSKLAFQPYVGNEEAGTPQSPDGTPYKTCVSIHMPRWASRLTLIVTDVRVERLQDISEQDAIAEGVEPITDFMPYGHHWKRYRDGGWNGYVDSPIASYASLWTEINGPGSWEANPFVAAYTFTVIKQNIDQIEKVAA